MGKVVLECPRCGEIVSGRPVLGVLTCACGEKLPVYSSGPPPKQPQHSPRSPTSPQRYSPQADPGDSYAGLYVLFLCNVAWFVSGLLTFGFYVYWCFKWWGAIGAVAAVLVAPLCIAFPFIYLAKEGFSFFFFGVWGIGILALMLAGALRPD